MKKAITILAVVFFLVTALYIGWKSHYRYYTASGRAGSLTFYRVDLITGKIVFQNLNTKGNWVPLARMVIKESE